MNLPAYNKTRLWLFALCFLFLSSPGTTAELAEDMKQVSPRIVYETWQDGNWELFTIRADGSGMVNLTKTPDQNELYPHVSPDGTKLCFVCDEGTGPGKIRNVYVMNLDRTDRTLVAKNARQPCWKWDSTAIAYLKGEVDQFNYRDYATNGICSAEVIGAPPRNRVPRRSESAKSQGSPTRVSPETRLAFAVCGRRPQKSRTSKVTRN